MTSKEVGGTIRAPIRGSTVPRKLEARHKALVLAPSKRDSFDPEPVIFVPRVYVVVEFHTGKRTHDGRTERAR